MTLQKMSDHQMLHSFILSSQFKSSQNLFPENVPHVNHSSTTNDIARPNRATSLFAAITCVIIIIIGCVGNTVTIIALVRCRKLRNATTAFVVSLACSDLLFCCLNLPLTAYRYFNEGWTLGHEMCMLFPFFFYGNVGASLMSMTAITFNRFVLINCYSHYSKVYSRANLAIMIAFCWIVSFAILIPTLVGSWGRFGYKEDSFSCTILPNDDGTSPKKFLFIFGFLMPAIVICLCYSCIFYKVIKGTKNLMSHNSNVASCADLPSVSRRRDEIRLTKMMLLIFCTFILCFLPLMIVNVFEREIRQPLLHVLSSILAWMSSCTNPVIYAILNRQYRQAYVQLFYSTAAVVSSTISKGSCGATPNSTTRNKSSDQSCTTPKVPSLRDIAV